MEDCPVRIRRPKLPARVSGSVFKIRNNPRNTIIVRDASHTLARMKCRMSAMIRIETEITRPISQRAGGLVGVRQQTGPR